MSLLSQLEKWFGVDMDYTLYPEASCWHFLIAISFWRLSDRKIIEDLEETKRGLYSGAVGYFEPSGDFDFNVIIRSILYNASKKYISYSVGSAITAKSDPQKEYEECLIKAKAMREVLEG